MHESYGISISLQIKKQNKNVFNVHNFKKKNWAFIVGGPDHHASDAWIYFFKKIILFMPKIFIVIVLMCKYSLNKKTYYKLIGWKEQLPIVNSRIKEIKMFNILFKYLTVVY